MPATKNRNWLWFFAVLIVLGVAAISINYWYNVHQQLTPEQLDAAEKKWEQHGPSDYDLVIRKEINSYSSDLPDRQEYKIKVRSKQVIEAVMNDKPLEVRLWSKNDMPSWFGFLNEFMEIDKKPGAPRVYCVAEFDPVDGHPLRYVRRAGGTQLGLTFTLTSPAR